MKQIVIGILVFLIWLVISTYWYVCGIRGLCEEPKPEPTVVLLPQEELAPVKEPEPEPLPPPPPPKVVEKKEYKLPAIYFIFERDSVKNVDDMIAAAKRVYSYLRDDDSLKLYVTGHACGLSESENADELSLMRANAIKKYMIIQGVPGEKIITISRGADDPQTSSDPQERMMLNRRVEMIVR